MALRELLPNLVSQRTSPQNSRRQRAPSGRYKIQKEWESIAIWKAGRVIIWHWGMRICRMYTGGTIFLQDSVKSYQCTCRDGGRPWGSERKRLLSNWSSWSLFSGLNAKGDTMFSYRLLSSSSSFTKFIKPREVIQNIITVFCLQRWLRFLLQGYNSYLWNNLGRENQACCYSSWAPQEMAAVLGSWLTGCHLSSASSERSGSTQHTAKRGVNRPDI